MSQPISLHRRDMYDKIIYVKIRNSQMPEERTQCQDHFALSEIAPAISPERANSTVSVRKRQKSCGLSSARTVDEALRDEPYGDNKGQPFRWP